jgi:uncharacterized protein involved in cysteine biosynthesis
MFSARILAVVFVPLVGAAVLWSVIAWFAWEQLSRWLAHTFLGGDGSWSHWVAGAGAALLLMLAAVLTVLAAVAVLAMPVIVAAVAARDFPLLARGNGGTFAGSLGNAMVAIVVFLPLALLALFLLALPPLFAVASLFLNAWLNQRLFRYDALALHADHDELPAVIRGARGRLMTLGLLLAPLSLIPLVNLIAPIYAGIAFTYLCLDELAAFRSRATASPNFGP